MPSPSPIESRKAKGTVMIPVNISADEAARVIGICTRQFYRDVKSGKIDVRTGKSGRRVLYSYSDIVNYAESLYG